jgi:hypothetical protein
MDTISNIANTNNALIHQMTGKQSPASIGATNVSGPVDSDGDHDGSLPGVPDAGDRLLNVTA